MAGIRCAVSLAPGESTTVDWISGVGATLKACVDLMRKYRDRTTADGVDGGARVAAQAVLD